MSTAGGTASNVANAASLNASLVGPQANPRFIGTFTPQTGFQTILVNEIMTYSTGTVQIYNTDLEGTITGSVLGAPNGLATLGPTGVVPNSQLPPFSSLTGTTSATETFLGVNAGNATVTGANNTAIGIGSLNVVAGGSGNTGLGYNSLNTVTSGANNIAIGLSAAAAVTNSLNNIIAIGQSAMQNATVSGIGIGDTALLHNGGNNNVGVGNSALSSALLSGANNVAIGTSALSGMTSGNSNVGIGTSTLSGVNNGAFNTAIGYQAAIGNAAVTNNTAIGYTALQIVNSNGNTAVGSSALSTLGAGPNNTAVGFQAMAAEQTGGPNVAIGAGALLADNGGTYIVAIGADAASVTANLGTQCIAIGNLAMNTSTGLTQSIGIGFTAASGAAATSTNLVAIGYNAMSAITGVVTDNVGIGTNALETLTGPAGNRNVGIGSNALNTVGNGNQNVAIGYNSAIGCAAGVLGNTALGAFTLTGVSTNYNTAIGGGALNSLTTGGFNTGVGSQAITALESGSTNVAIGYQILTALMGGSNNVSVGMPGNNLVNGNQNTMLGSGGGPGGDFSNTITIGADAATTASNSCVIGTAATTSYGIYGTWSNLSDARYKKNITDVSDDQTILGLVQSLRPRKFETVAPRYAHEYGLRHGFIAQEVLAAMKQANYDDFGGYQYDPVQDTHQLRHDYFHALTVRSIQILMSRIDSLEKKIAAAFPMIADLAPDPLLSEVLKLSQVPTYVQPPAPIQASPPADDITSSRGNGRGSLTAIRPPGTPRGRGRGAKK